MFTTNTPPARPYRNRRWFVVLMILILIFGAYTFASLYIGLARTVYLVNGLDKSYTVNLAGRDYTLPPLSHTKVKVSEGTFPVNVADSALGIPAQSCSITTPFFHRLFLNRVYVINPDRAALMFKAQSVYSRDAATDNTTVPEFFAGELLTEYRDIDYVFEDFPKTIKISSDQKSDIYKTRLAQYTKGNMWERYVIIGQAVGDPDAKLTYVHAYEAAHPERKRPVDPNAATNPTTRGPTSKAMRDQ